MKTTTIEVTKEEARVIYLALREYKRNKLDSQSPTIKERVAVCEELTDYDGKVFNAWKEMHSEDYFG